MSIWSQMFNALKGETDDFEENKKAIRILDDELRAASLNLKDSKDALADLIAKQKLAEENIRRQTDEIKEHETFAQDALEKADETLALEIAARIVDMDARLNAERDQQAVLQSAIRDMQDDIGHAELNVKRLKLQVQTIKATESVQRAQAAVAKRHSKNRPDVHTAQQALDALRQRQATKAEELKAERELQGDGRKDDLRQKLQDAGIVTGSPEANDVLARIKKSKKG